MQRRVRECNALAHPQVFTYQALLGKGGVPAARADLRERLRNERDARPAVHALAQRPHFVEELPGIAGATPATRCETMCG